MLRIISTEVVDFSYARAQYIIMCKAVFGLIFVKSV